MTFKNLVIGLVWFLLGLTAYAVAEILARLFFYVP